jgi:SagB-type dehydrogenase family enzyme
MKDPLTFVIALALVLCFAAPVWAEAPKPIQLPAPQTDGGRPLMQVLKDRATSRDFKSDPLPAQELSNLLWAADGINRPDSGKRTAPTAMDRREIDIYVVTADGAFAWDPKANVLNQVATGDLREATGKQDFVKVAPLELLFVADYAKMGERGKEMHELFSWVDTGYISQNVYLYCANAGLATVVRAMLDRDPLAKAMNLRADQKIVLAQTVGYPKK